MEPSEFDLLDDMSDRDVRNALAKCAQIMHDPVFTGKGSHLALESMVALLMITVKDILMRADKDGNRIDFTDDVQTVPGKVSDVTDLICKARCVACHIFSDGLLVDETNRFYFSVINGYCPNAGSINDFKISCDYADDTALYFGRYRVYYRRHLVRAVKELIDIYGY